MILKKGRYPMLPQGCFPLLLFLLLLVLIPLFLAEVMLTALSKLGLSSELSLFAAFGIFLGGLVNIPVQKIPNEQIVEDSSKAFFAMDRFFRKPPTQQHFTIIAINLGGCIIPCIIAIYQLARIISHSSYAMIISFVAIALNTFVCYRLAKPIPKVGIALPALVPALIAALSAIIFIPDFAPPIAFCAGVLGPLIGADLMHIQEIKHINTRVASIGGAGTFDGIVISGLLATLLV